MVLSKWRVEGYILSEVNSFPRLGLDRLLLCYHFKERKYGDKWVRHTSL